MTSEQRKILWTGSAVATNDLGDERSRRVDCRVLLSESDSILVECRARSIGGSVRESNPWLAMAPGSAMRDAVLLLYIARLRLSLATCTVAIGAALDYFEERADTADNSDGTVGPNTAMSHATALGQALSIAQAN